MVLGGMLTAHGGAIMTAGAVVSAMTNVSGMRTLTALTIAILTAGLHSEPHEIECSRGVDGHLERVVYLRPPLGGDTVRLTAFERARKRWTRTSVSNDEPTFHTTSPKSSVQT